VGRFQNCKATLQQSFPPGYWNRKNSIPKDIVATEYVDARFEAKCPCFRDQNDSQRRINERDKK